jgi:hypothetical protein
MSNILSKLAILGLVSGAGLLSSLSIASQASALTGSDGYKYKFYDHGDKYYCSEPYKPHFSKSHYISKYCKESDGDRGSHDDGNDSHSDRNDRDGRKQGGPDRDGGSSSSGGWSSHDKY